MSALYLVLSLPCTICVIGTFGLAAPYQVKSDKRLTEIIFPDFNSRVYWQWCVLSELSSSVTSVHHHLHETRSSSESTTSESIVSMLWSSFPFLPRLKWLLDRAFIVCWPLSFMYCFSPSLDDKVLSDFRVYLFLYWGPLYRQLKIFLNLIVYPTCLEVGYII